MIWEYVIWPLHQDYLLWALAAIIPVSALVTLIAAYFSDTDGFDEDEQQWP